MATLTLNEVLVIVFDSDDDRDDFDTTVKANRRKMKEYLPILASSSLAWRSWKHLAKLFLLSL